MGGGSLVAAASTSELRGQGVNVRGGDEAMPGGGGAVSFGAARVAAQRIIRANERLIEYLHRAGERARGGPDTFSGGRPLR
eukprot:scaffold109714_cov44-Phaeocystis_antarctica.AAC.1